MTDQQVFGSLSAQFIHSQHFTEYGNGINPYQNYDANVDDKYK